MTAPTKISALDNPFENDSQQKIFHPTSRHFQNRKSGNIYRASIPGGGFVNLFKTLYTNSCSFDCKYCVNSACSEKRRRITYKPGELAKVFMNLYRRKMVEGLFLSSAIPTDPDKTMEEMLQAVYLLRTKHKFSGYVHLKILPGTNYNLIKQASELADRLSVNLEVPSKDRMSSVSTTKDYKTDILRRQRWMSKMSIPSGQTTQFVIGASGESDLEVLERTDYEYKKFNVRRVYFSAFSPCKGTPFQDREKTPVLRETRLYNTDWLMRVYGIPLKEIKQILVNDFLPREDPKIRLARNYFSEPVDPNEASYSELIRIPGIGLATAKKILDSKEKLKSRKQLLKLGAILERAEPFIKINGRCQTTLSNFS